MAEEYHITLHASRCCYCYCYCYCYCCCLQALGANSAAQCLVLALHSELASLPPRKLAPAREAISQGLQVRCLWGRCLLRCCAAACCLVSGARCAPQVAQQLPRQHGRIFAEVSYNFVYALPPLALAACCAPHAGGPWCCSCDVHVAAAPRLLKSLCFASQVQVITPLTLLLLCCCPRQAHGQYLTKLCANSALVDIARLAGLSNLLHLDL
jgi:hypothetical protein